MKTLFVLTIAIFSCILSLGQTNEVNNYGVILFYRISGSAKIDIAVTINNYRVCNMTKKTSVIHKVFSEGSLILKGEVTNMPAFSSKQINADIKNADTLYVKIGASMGFASGNVEMTLMKKEDFRKDIEGYTFESTLQTKEDISFPYNPITEKKLFKNAEKSGTGFLVSSEGYIVTNYHVVENAKEITVKGVNGNPKSSLSASLLLKDETNDLVILKLDDRISIDSIPYTLKKEGSDIGENVYVFGYPLISTMGSDVKLTNGLISARSGFEGNINSYQVSAPVQPGNSGGPVFDSNGNIIAIVNAKHLGTENVSYAIKVKYLFDLLDAADKPVKLNQANKLSGKTLTEQVKNISNFVYIVMAK